MTESICNPLTLYLTRLAPSSQLTMRYVLQDAADRLGFEDLNLEEIDWHLLQPEHVIALVAALFGFGGIAAGAAGIAKILFFVFVIMAAVTFVISLVRKT